MVLINIRNTIGAPAKCDFRSVIRFLRAEGRNSAETHRRKLRARKWHRKFQEGQIIDVHGRGRKSMVTDNVVEQVDKVVRERYRFTIHISDEFRMSCVLQLEEVDLRSEHRTWRERGNVSNKQN